MEVATDSAALVSRPATGLEAAAQPSPAVANAAAAAAAAAAGQPSPVELEHALGFNARTPHTVAIHPTALPQELVHACGKLLVLAKPDDVHMQSLLRGHDAWVSALTISPSGRYIASGQEASQSTKGLRGTVVVWDYATKTPVHHLPGHHHGVTHLAFSPDERWLASTGLDGRTFIWDMHSGELAGGVKDVTDSERASEVLWGTIEEPGTRRQAYTFFALYNTGVRRCVWRFDVKRMQHSLSQDVFRVPGAGGRIGGFVREYTCGALSGGQLLCGTASSDVVVFNTETLLYVTSFSVGAGSVASICVVPGSDSVLVGCGDGQLVRIHPAGGGGWEAAREVRLQGGIRHVCVAGDGASGVATTSVGVLYRFLTDALTATAAMQCHTGPILDLAFPSSHSDSFASSSASPPTVKVFSLSHYGVVCSVPCGARGDGAATCLSYAPHAPDTLVMGMESGALHAYCVAAPEGRLQWSIATAHRGCVTSLAVTDRCVLSAGQDGVARVWSLASRQCVATVEHHRKPVTAILPDATSPSIFHTCSTDKTIMTFDMAQMEGTPRRPTRLTHKSDPSSQGFVALAQRTAGERELIAASADGVIQYAAHPPHPLPVLSTPLFVPSGSLTLTILMLC